MPGWQSPGGRLRQLGPRRGRSLSAAFSPFSLPGLYAWYPLDDGSGTTMRDASGNGRTHTFVAAHLPTWVTEGLNYVPQQYSLRTENWTPAAMTVYLVSGLAGITDAQYPQENGIGGADAGVGTEWNLAPSAAGTSWSYFQHKSTSPISGCVTHADKGWHMQAATWDGATSKIWLDDGALIGSGPASGSKTHTGSYIGTFVVAQFLRGKIGSVLMYDQAHTQPQIRRVFAYLKGVMARRGVGMWSYTNQLILDGDSLISKNDLFVNTLTPKVRDALVGTWNITNLGFGGKRADQLLTDFPDKVVPALTSTVSGKRVAIVLAGTNDLAAGASAATTTARLTSLLAAYKARGEFAKVGVVKLLPRTDGVPGFAANRATVNANLDALVGTGVDFVVTPSAAIFTDLASDDLANFDPDKVHLNATGNGVLGGDIAAAANAA